MARPCTVCANPARASIDLRLLRGETASSIAKEHNLKIDSLLRHKANHLAKSSEASTTIGMLRQVIAELDEAALTALARGDHRAAIDSRKMKANTLQSLLQVESQETQATIKTSSGRIPISLLDDIVAKVMKDHTQCPLCGGYTVPKATGNATGKPVN